MLNMMDTQRHPQGDTECIYAFKAKTVPLPNIDLSQVVARKQPEDISQLNNTIVETLNNKLRQFNEEILKPRLKRAEVTSDSIGEDDGNCEPREYCMPLTVTTTTGELPLIERHYVPPTTIERDGYALPSPAIQVQTDRDVNMATEDDLSSSSSSDSGEDDIGDNSPLIRNVAVEPLREELLKKCLNDSVQVCLGYLQHAFWCQNVGGPVQCDFGEKCTAKQTKKFCDENITSAECASHELVMATIFYHAMHCQIPMNMKCEMPYCSQFKNEYFALKSSTSRSNEFKMLYTDNDYFQCEEDSPRIVREGNNFQIVVEKSIGKGSFGEVFDTWIHTDKGSARMANKKMRSKMLDAPSIDHFQELGKSPYLLFPNTILMDTRDPPNLMYMIMEKEENTLRSYVKQRRDANAVQCQEKEQHGNGCNCYPVSLTREQTTLYFFQLTCAVKYLHDHGFTHGDIKPENIVMGSSNLEVKLTDFDSLKKEEVQQRFGTPGYNAPELMNPESSVIKPSDIYSLSCCLPEMLLGKFMYCNASQEGIRRRNECLAAFMDRIDPILAHIFSSGVNPTYKDRPTIDQLHDYPELHKQKSYVDMNPPVPFLAVNANNDQPISVPRKWLDKSISEIMDTLPRSLVGPCENLDMMDYNKD